jgi:hypothetical protein
VALLGFCGNKIYDKAVDVVKNVSAIERKVDLFEANRSSDSAQWRLIKEQEDKIRVLETRSEVNRILVDKFTNYSLMIHANTPAISDHKEHKAPPTKEFEPLIFVPKPKAPVSYTPSPQVAPPVPTYVFPHLTPQTIEEETKEKYEEVLKELQNHKSENVKQYQNRQQSFEGKF